MPIPPPGAVEQLLELLEAGDRAGVTDLIRALRAGGATTTELIADLLAPAQRRVGELWQTLAWDVAQEHLATGIVDAALADLELHTEPAQLRGDVVVACAEGEWHALPARMMAEQLRHHGWAVTFLGPSLPADDLRRFLQRSRPVAVAVSCSISAHLEGAQRSIAAVHAAGLPALAGGPAFGHDRRRAVAIGADGWAPSAAVADALLAEWAATPGPRNFAEAIVDPAPFELGAARRDIVDLAEMSIGEALGSDLEVGPTLSSILEFAGAALLTGDDSVLDEHLQWLRDVVTARHGSPEVVDGWVAALADALSPEHPEVRSLLIGTWLR